MIRGRVERAKTLMRETDAPSARIALDSGFCDQAHMSRQFHAVVGSTPSRWRASSRISSPPTALPPSPRRFSMTRKALAFALAR
ncbi:helix-turn-helix domain-containing protein [Caulobacter segnis]